MNTPPPPHIWSILQEAQTARDVVDRTAVESKSICAIWDETHTDWRMGHDNPVSSALAHSSDVAEHTTIIVVPNTTDRIHDSHVYICKSVHIIGTEFTAMAKSLCTKTIERPFGNAYLFTNTASLDSLFSTHGRGMHRVDAHADHPDTVLFKILDRHRSGGYTEFVAADLFSKAIRYAWSGCHRRNIPMEYTSIAQPPWETPHISTLWLLHIRGACVVHVRKQDATRAQVMEVFPHATSGTLVILSGGGIVTPHTVPVLTVDATDLVHSKLEEQRMSRWVSVVRVWCTRHQHAIPSATAPLITITNRCDRLLEMVASQYNGEEDSDDDAATVTSATSVTCLVCHDGDFTDHNTPFLMYPCGHTCCIQCTHTMFANNMRTCPICKQTLYVTVMPPQVNQW